VKWEVVPLGVGGIKRSMQTLRMLPGEPEPPPKSQRSFSTIHLVHADRGGAVKLLVELGQDVKKGQKVAEIGDVFGNKVEELFAPASGFVHRIVKLANVATGAEILWVSN